MKRILALMMAVMCSMACFSGCGHAPTEEELANGYEGLQKTPLEDIQVRTEKNGAIAKLFVYIGVTEDEMAVEYSSVYEGGRWILVPP